MMLVPAFASATWAGWLAREVGSTGGVVGGMGRRRLAVISVW